MPHFPLNSNFKIAHLKKKINKQHQHVMCQCIIYSQVLNQNYGELNKTNLNANQVINEVRSPN